MRLIKSITTFITLVIISTQAFSQEKLLDTLPKTKEEFIKSEPDVIQIVDWLEGTPLNQEQDKRKLLNAKFLAWLTNSPTVTISINSKVAPLSKKNPDLLFVFMGGWTKYTLQNSYSKDAVKCNLAGIKSVIKVYQMGNGVKKDKEIEKLIDMDAKSELEAWIKSRLGQK